MTVTPITLADDITIHPVVEQQSGDFFQAMQFFPTLAKEIFEENRSWLEPAFIDANGGLVLCIQSFVVKTPHHNILIDSCVGNHKPRPKLPFWDMLGGDRFERELAGAEVTVNDIDFVMCTHLHPDHVGWNTRLENGCWIPTFPKARYIMADRELAHWTERETKKPESCPWITDSVLPIVAVDRAQVVKSDFVLDDAVRCIPTPGHTIDHFSVLVGRSGRDAFITGDMIHSPLQGRYPEIGAVPDYDPQRAKQTRRDILDRFCEQPTIFCASHFPAPLTATHIRRWGDGYKFIAAD